RVLVPGWGGEGAAAALSGVIGELLAAGAVGYCCQAAAEPSNAPGLCTEEPCVATAAVDPAVLASLIYAPQRWLIHCTRAPQGPWPGQSEQQFRDGLLLSPPQVAEPTPLTTLQRIVMQRKLVGTSRTITG